MTGLAAIVTCAILAVAAYDIWLIVNRRPTISEAFTALGERTPLAVAAICLLTGMAVGGLLVHFWG